MNKILELGRWIFPLSFLMYVGLHLGKPEVGASFVPDFLPFPYFWNYFTLVCIVLFIVSALIRKYDKLAYAMMALYVILMAFLVHLPIALGMNIPMDTMGMDLTRTRELEMINVFRNIMVAAALMGFAQYIATDRRLAN